TLGDRRIERTGRRRRRREPALPRAKPPHAARHRGTPPPTNVDRLDRSPASAAATDRARPYADGGGPCPRSWAGRRRRSRTPVRRPVPVHRTCHRPSRRTPRRTGTATTTTPRLERTQPD